MSSKVVRIFLSFILLAQGLVLLCPWEGSAQEAPSDGVSGYGQIYVAERSLHEIKPWRTTLSYGFEFGNSYQDVHHVKLSLEHSLGRYAWLGVQASFYRGYSSNLFQTLQTQLMSRDVLLEGHAPSFSVFPVFTWSPIGGHFSFLRDRPIEAELGIQVGAGYIKYSGSAGRSGVLWAIRPVIHLTSSLSVLGSFGQDIESVLRSEDRLSHLRGELGMAYQF